MFELTWQKSSYSGSGENDCIEVAAGHHILLLRESEEPGHVLAPTAVALNGLLRHLKAGDTRPR